MAVTAVEVEWVYLNPGDEARVKVGELVSSDAGGMPIYRVVAIREDRAWLKDLQDGADRVTPLSAFHWKALPAANDGPLRG